jgi:hypothetical protein
MRWIFHPIDASVTSRYRSSGSRVTLDYSVDGSPRTQVVW